MNIKRQTRLVEDPQSALAWDVRTIAAPLAIVLLALSVLAGCDADAPAPDESPVAAEPTSAKAAARLAELTKGMVRGVTAEKPGAAVGLKFDIKSAPQAGEPFKVEVAIFPSHAGDVMRATFISGAELAIQPSAAPAEYHNVEAGNVYRHEITVTPRENGVFYLSAIVQLDAEGEAQVRTFSIPVIVGTQDEAAQKPAAAPPTDATGQPIQSMPVQ